MVRVGTGGRRVPRDPIVAETWPGKRLERLLRSAMAQHETIHGIQELARAAGMHHNSLYAWFHKPTDPLFKQPSGEKALAVCRALNIPVATFWETWEGVERQPDSAELELRAHREAMERQTEAIERLLRVLTSGAVAAGVLRALEEEGAGSGDGTPE